MSLPSPQNEERAQKLAAMITFTRQKAKKSVEEAAALLGISPEQFDIFESGSVTPSLPELECLAWFFDVPLEYFWSDNSTVSQDEQFHEPLVDLLEVRQRMVGALLRLTRIDKPMTMEELAGAIRIPEARLALYELGEIAIPLVDLEKIVDALNIKMEDLFDQSGPVGRWRTQHQALRYIFDLPEEVQEFVFKPANRPYLELSLRLSQMQVNKLRAVAESLLEITF